MMALVDVLDSFPEEHPQRKELIETFKNLSASLLEYRDSKTKLWYQVVDLGDQEGNYIETSSSLMYIYSFAKGTNKGYLSEEYLNVAKESFESLLANFLSVDQNGIISLNNTVSVGGLGGKPYRDGSFEYYISEPIRVNDFKGYGPLLLAAIEISKNK
jgi:unsaturated rhamnogalacturonyl hydrolase